MPITAKLPDGRTITVPDDTTPEELDAIVNAESGEQSPFAGASASSGPDLGNRMLADPGPFGSTLRGVMNGGVMSIGQPAAEGTRRVIHGLANRMYRGALKPTKAVASRTQGGERALADTGLREGITVSQRGLRKAEDAIGGLSDQVEQVIQGSTATIPRRAVGQRLNDVYDQFRNQVAPTADLHRIRNIGREFRQTNPSQIPVQRAQQIKQGTYRAQGKKYGQQGGAEVEAEKALARGLKEEIETAVPDVVPLNARESALIQLRKALEDASRRTGNRDVVGLTDVIAAGTQPGMLAATLGMRARPTSAAAIGLDRTGRAVDPEALQAALRALILGAQEQE